MFYLATVTSTSDNLVIEDATKQANSFMRFWQAIDWDSIISLVLSKGLVLILAFVIIMIIKRLGTTLIKRGFDNYKNKEHYSERRIDTLYKLANNAFQYSLYFVILYTVLTILGVPVGSLIAGAGIAGIAIGLGAQSFISDILTGFFIILERQIDIGNHVIIDDIEGTVESIGLRTTQIKGFDGTLHYIPNGQITIVSNLSRENMRAIIQLRVKPEHDIQEISAIIKQVNQHLLPNYPEIKKGPQNLGLVDLGNGNLAIKIVIYTLNGEQLRIQADFLTAYLAALTKAGYDLPESPLPMTSK
ncbi:mechanosensitive ion channel family protein [Vagococcus intermedius]|uniref:Mechanosensitive ion channel family protein n=1 Tax=Vagococcus intermedius TaxID=2991418 RepID=A0AAF0I8J8_9ENTE|nr:mechanosensitive ion channel family protein [Vagococcus intermedius]WEG74041.1 mechanosensitive ion channel family protein [Vagococcus intermedius]WEG76121.1 mechanosensitive ion channel family protein [Vagococcus intermedius]